MKKALSQAIPMAEAFCRLLHPFAEVVIHDFESDTIVAIYNPLSKREVGDPSYLDRIDFSIELMEQVIGPYDKINYDGRQMKSISVILRDEASHAQGFLCVNVDISPLLNPLKILSLFLENGHKQLSPKQEELFKEDLYEQINAFVQEYCRTHQRALTAMGREEKRELISLLKQRGAFEGKHAAHYVARILEISRATVYNYLKEEKS